MSSLAAPVVSHMTELRTTPGAFPDHPETNESEQDLTHLSLSEAIQARRSEFTRPRKLRIKVGSWNVAAKSGTDKDITGWFAEGKGVAEELAGLTVVSADDAGDNVNHPDGRESVQQQESRATKRTSTIPQGDQGTLPGAESIELYALGLQEVVDINSPAEALRPRSDPSVASRWKKALEDAFPAGYKMVAEQQLTGLLLLVYASSEIASSITSVSTSSVGTGLMGYMGNKGAVAARLVLEETTTLVFINSHMAAGTEKASLERRNWDAAQIASRIKFYPSDNTTAEPVDYHEGIGAEDFAWWFGDLNYRLDKLPGEDVRRLLMLHTNNEYDLSRRSDLEIEREFNESLLPIVMDDTESTSRASVDSDTTPASSTTADVSTTRSSVESQSTSTRASRDERPDPHYDPTSLQTTLSSLLPHDQLHQQQAMGKAFHDGWREGPINFLPTYKYDVGTVGVFDSSEKKRGPSWCDRILYRTKKDKLAHDRKVKEEAEARRKDDEMRARGIDKAADDDDVLFDYDPEADGAEDTVTNDVATTPRANEIDYEILHGRAEDRLKLDIYSSHLRVLSSDHKPLSAVFTLSYDAIVPELKTKVHQAVARDLDRAENEARPAITVAVDHHHGRSLLEEDASKASDHPDRFDPSVSDHIDFGEVHYQEAIARSVTIANTGGVPATLNFVDRSLPGSFAGVSPWWLNLRFDHQGEHILSGEETDVRKETTLEPGDTINVNLTLHIQDIEHVRALNDGRETLEDILVLRVVGGRDHFLPVRGAWMHSSFGRTINELIRVPEGGVRTLQGQKSSEGAATEQTVKWSAPREIFRLTEAIEELVERTIAERSMTGSEEEKVAPWEEHPGWPFATDASTQEDASLRSQLKLQVHEAIDSNRNLRTAFPHEVSTLVRIEVIAETVITFLQTLEDGIITESLWTELEAGMIANDKAKKDLSVDEEQTWILDVLSTTPNHNICFVFLTSMLARVASETAPVHQQQAASSPSSPSAPKSSRRSTGLSVDPAIARRKQVDQALAEIFAEAMIKRPTLIKEKERKIQEARMKKVVEVFLTGKWQSGT